MPTLVCTFDQDGQELLGSCSDGEGYAARVAAGVADGVTVSWVLDAPGATPNGATVRYSFSGELGEEGIQGDVQGRDLSGFYPTQYGSFRAGREDRQTGT